MGTIENRRLFRTQVILRMTYETTSDPKTTGVVLTANLSSSGANIIGIKKFDLDSEVRFKLYLNGNRTVDALGKIIWQKKCGYIPKSQTAYYSTGVQFLDMTPEDAIVTSDFIFESAKNQREEEEKLIINKLEVFKSTN